MKKNFGIILCLIVFSVSLFAFINQVSDDQVKNLVNTFENEYKESKKLSMFMVGDVLIHGALYKDAFVSGDKYDFTEMFSDYEAILSQYDLKYYNQESIIGGKNLGLSTYPRFNSPDEIGLNAISAGFNVVSLANNHSLDKGEQGIRYSNSFWKKQTDVIVSGTNESLEDQNYIPVYEKNGIKYSFISYTTTTNGLNLPSGKDYLVNVYSDELAKKQIESIKDKTDLIIVAIHWGTEYSYVPNESQKNIAQYLSNLGVNLIIGAHPHVVQPITYVNDTLVIYSLGNFLAAQSSLGINKCIGLTVGVDMVLKDNKIIFENLNKELSYIYNKNYRDYHIYPFSKLNKNILNDYESYNEKFMGIVNS